MPSEACSGTEVVATRSPPAPPWAGKLDRGIQPHGTLRVTMDEPVMVSLSNHGVPLTDCGKDSQKKMILYTATKKKENSR